MKVLFQQLFSTQIIIQILTTIISVRLIYGFCLLYAHDVFCCHFSGIVVVEVAMDMIVFVQYGLHLLDVVYGVEYNIVGRVTDADAETGPLQ